ncbi:Crp/Fnr family transcriptional regulator [Paracoccus sp. MBLB3053]|uniref:Crp/Fnr family transcriptional regulator n=1 Tax=Paracoccus aurantius TaxID=3073814 RepID=A0ABU2HSA8_9RHOB|nr:Crp/Fnr family transcriptional regulator [Paracoccus sp. MBLB3053]MDS9467908.1 Crp/Fnr family transcriptional regulator [Paracoccus sp. MBLB3053]
MGNSKNIALTQSDRRTLRGRGWLHGRPLPFADAVLDNCMLLGMERGDSAMHLGDESGGLYGLIEGWLDVLISPGALDPTLVHVATTGWWFGDSALLTQSPKRGAHIARTPCRIAYLPAEAAGRLDRAGFEAWRNIAHISVGVIDHAFAVIAANRTQQPIQRAALTLRILLGEGLHFAAGAALDPPVLPISQTEFAEIANLSRNAAGDALRHLAHSGAIRLGYRGIEIVDTAMLHERNVALDR